MTALPESRPQPVVNHEEARQLAEYNREYSNLARCYLDLCARSEIAPKGMRVPFDLWDEIEDFIHNYVDVVDGDDGPRPNKAMHLMGRIQAEVNNAAERVGGNDSAPKMRGSAVSEGIRAHPAAPGSNPGPTAPHNDLRKAAQAMVESFKDHVDRCRACTINWQNLKAALHDVPARPAAEPQK